MALIFSCTVMNKGLKNNMCYKQEHYIEAVKIKHHENISTTTFGAGSNTEGLIKVLSETILLIGNLSVKLICLLLIIFSDEISDKEVKKSETLVVDKVPKRKRRNRSHFTQRQLQYLEKIFSRQQYLTRDERTLLARGLEMTELQIRNWFQNRRYQKKHCATKNTKQDELDSAAACLKSED